MDIRARIRGQIESYTYGSLFRRPQNTGGIAGVVALLWRAWDEFGSHLRISIKVDGPKDGWVTVLTTVDNKGNRPKDISYALLLLGPEAESPLDTARLLAKATPIPGSSGLDERFG